MSASGALGRTARTSSFSGSSPRARASTATEPSSAQAQTQPRTLDLGPLETFLRPDFDVKAFTREALSSSDGPESILQTLRSHLETVEHAISTHVAAHEEALLGTLESVSALKREMIRGKNDATALSVSLTRVENEFKEPYDRLKTTSHSLRNAHEATGILRKLGWFLVARKKLKTTLEEQKLSDSTGSAKEASKAAQLVAELEELMNDNGLKGVSLVDAEARWIKEVGQKVRQDAQKAFEKAIISLNQGEMGLALQAFFHLNILEDRVSYVAIWAGKEFTQEAREALRDASGSSSTSTDRVAALRTRVDGLLERSLRSWAVRVWNLQRVLTKKRDPTTHVLFADVVKVDVFEQFWTRATSALEQELKTCPRWVREALTEDYARLRRSAKAMLGRLWTSTSSVAGHSGQANVKKLAVGGPRETQALMQAFHPFVSEFLGQCLSRLNQPVQVMFPEEESRGLRHVEPKSLKAIPTANDVITFAQIISKELAAVKGDPELLSAVAKPCAMAVSLFYEKSQALVSKAEGARTLRLVAPELAFSTFSASATPVSSTARNAIQEHNINVLTLVSLLSSRLRETIEQVLAANKDGVSQEQGDQVDTGIEGLESGNGDYSDDDADDGKLDEDELVDAEQIPSGRTPQPAQSFSQSSSFLARLETARQQLDQLINEILSEYVGGEYCVKALDDLIQDMNAEDYNPESDSGSSTRSYTAKFAKACKTLHDEHLVALPQNDLVCIELINSVVITVANRIALRACMVRPLSSAGASMLVRDVKSLESSLQQVYLGQRLPISVTDSITTLFAGLERLLLKRDSPAVLVKAGVVTKTHVWHHLFCSAAPEVRSPNMKQGKSVTVYINEIEKASEEKVWSIVQDCVTGKDSPLELKLAEIRAL